VLLLNPNRNARSVDFLIRWTALLCLLLLVFAATAEARHIHANATDAQRCSVCVVAHSPTLVVRVAIVAPIRVSQPLVTTSEAPTVSATAHDTHCIRPPPAA
jgi:hypothetical protein